MIESLHLELEGDGTSTAETQLARGSHEYLRAVREGERMDRPSGNDSMTVLVLHTRGDGDGVRRWKVDVEGGSGGTDVVIKRGGGVGKAASTKFTSLSSMISALKACEVDLLFVL